MDPITGGAILGGIAGGIIAFIYSLITTKGAPKSKTEALQGVRGKGPGCGKQILFILIGAIIGTIGAAVLGAG